MPTTHSRWRSSAVLLFAACTGAGSDGPTEVGRPGQEAPGVQVTVVDAMTKVRPGIPVDGTPGAVLVAARNEFESFQVVVQAEDAPLENLTVAIAGPLAGPDGASIPASQATIYRVETIEVETASDLEGAPGPWPDPLIPSIDALLGEVRNAFPVDVPAGEQRVAWIDILVPMGTPAGTYAGVLDVRAEGRASRVPIELRVLDFELPSTASLRSAFGLSDDVCRPLGLEGCAGDPELAARTRALFVRTALDNRITIARPHTARITPASSAGLEAFRTWLLPLLEGTADTRLAGARLTSFQVNQVSDRAIAGWRGEVERLALEDRTFVWSCDEPHFFPVFGDPAGNWPLCIAVLEEDRASWPEARRLVTAHIQTVERHGRADLIDIMVVNVEFLDGPEDSPWFVGNQRPLYDDFLGAPGRELWLYSACGSHGCTRNDDPYTTGWAGGYEIDAPAAQTRAMPWLAFRYELQGLLYYDTVLQLATAWEDQYRYTGNGEGTLFYPGTPDRIGGTQAIPIESMRLKFLRDGFEDYEYLVHLRENGRAADAERIAAALFPTVYDTSRTPAEVRAARAELVELVDAITGE